MKIRINHSCLEVSSAMIPTGMNVTSNIGHDVKFCEEILDTLDARSDGVEAMQLMELMECQEMGNGIEGNSEYDSDLSILCLYLDIIPEHFNVTSVETDEDCVSIGVVLVPQ